MLKETKDQSFQKRRAISRRSRARRPSHARLVLGAYAKAFLRHSEGRAAPIASEALVRIAALYRIETEVRGQSAEVRRAVRQARSQPLIDELRSWLARQLDLVSGKSKIAEAIRYGLRHWDGLKRFLHDGRIEIDSNNRELRREMHHGQVRQQLPKIRL